MMEFYIAVLAALAGAYLLTKCVEMYAAANPVRVTGGYFLSIALAAFIFLLAVLA